MAILSTTLMTVIIDTNHNHCHVGSGVKQVLNQIQ